jgi:hypothetical protein
MDLINEENNVTASADLLQNLLETLLKVTAIAATGNECT